MNTELSTYVDYSTKDIPADVSLVEGQYYDVWMAGVARKVKILKIRMYPESDKIAVYWRYVCSSNLFGLSKSYREGCTEFAEFKAGLMDLGKISRLEIKGSKNEI